MLVTDVEMKALQTAKFCWLHLSPPKSDVLELSGNVLIYSSRTVTLPLDDGVWFGESGNVGVSLSQAL